MSQLTTPPARGFMMRLPPGQCDSGNKYIQPNPVFNPPSLYFGYVLSHAPYSRHQIVGKAPWGDEFGDTYPGDPKYAPSHPVLWHRGMMNACANRPLTDRPESYGYDMDEPSLYKLPNYGQTGTMYRHPRAIIYTCMPWEKLTFERFFLGTTGTMLANAGVFICRAPQFGGQDSDINPYTIFYNGWLDAFLPRDNFTLVPLDTPTVKVACFTTDNTKYVGGEVYEISRCECDGGNTEYWRPSIQPGGGIVPAYETAVSSFKSQQQLLKAKVCSKYRCTVLTFNDPSQPALTIPQTAFQIQVQLNNSLIAGLGNQWQQVAPGPSITQSPNDPTIVAAVNGLLPDIKQFFGIQ